MKTTTAVALTSLALVPCFGTVLVAPSGAATVEIADGDVNAAVGASNVSRRGDVVVGTLTNRGGDEIRDIRLLIDIAFLWTNEVKPGEDSPGRSAVMTVAGPLKPNGQLQFEFKPSPPLPERADGRYADPKVRVMGYQSVSRP